VALCQMPEDAALGSPWVGHHEAWSRKRAGALT